ncbi:hypothetical protein Y032_0029g1874 [Ancylostoma ceylanicum]|uniref:Uncharacterized protein n=1 Tax=Ancylostoma ceylanicum TaxID=53326 RepID=A0A016US83_9BILA|nr:hypothetical protein Y032_0029g1874 [Ancylostoma ceylanicum]
MRHFSTVFQRKIRGLSSMQTLTLLTKTTLIRYSSSSILEEFNLFALDTFWLISAKEYQEKLAVSNSVPTLALAL